MSSLAAGGGGGGGGKGMKRADKRSTITILVMGDEGVGKSSLISTFVSRYFSEVVPGILPRVRLPPDPATGSVTTIVDSQGADTALLSAIEARDGSGGGMTGSGSSLSSSVQQGGQQQPPPSQQQQQLGTSSSSSSAFGIESVDSIILVYDLNRDETFYRIKNYWLPLIVRCYNGKVPVIVAENKMDLYTMPDEQAVSLKRQQIVSLMQDFPFVQQCIKCSARNLLRYDDVFLKAQQAVIFPFTPPLYDLETGSLAAESKRAFRRIFRLYDADRDGLLSDAEVHQFQLATYNVGVLDRDLSAWKKVVERHAMDANNEPVLRDNKYTPAGFQAIFDYLISRNRLDVVWQALRQYGYDDDLNLHVPESVTTPLGSSGGGTGVPGGSTAAATTKMPVSWKLSSPARKFLKDLFRQYDSNRDGVLETEEILAMFDVLPPPALPPWSSNRASELFRGCFSLPKQPQRPSAIDTAALGGGGGGDGGGDAALMADSRLIVPAAETSSQQSLSQTGSILSASDLPTVNVQGSTSGSSMMFNVTKPPPLSYLEWMSCWHTCAAISSAVTRAELFRLGHVERDRARSSKQERWRKKKQRIGSVAPTSYVYDATLPSHEIRVLVLGGQGCGKTALLNALCSNLGNLGGGQEVAAATIVETTSTGRPETSGAFVKLRRKAPAGGKMSDSSTQAQKGQGEEFVVHLLFTDVPETFAASQKEHYRELSELFGSTTSPKDRVCDLAMLVFDTTTASSLGYAKELEKTLVTNATPRVFVGTKADLSRNTARRKDAGDEQGQSTTCTTGSVLEMAQDHCRSLDLEPPLVMSAAEMIGGRKEDQRCAALQHLARCALEADSGVERLKSKPHEEQKRRDAARRRKLMWFGGFAVLGVVAVSVGLLWGGGKCTTKDTTNGSSGGGGSFAWFRSWFRSGGSATSSGASSPMAPQSTTVKSTA